MSSKGFDYPSNTPVVTPATGRATDPWQSVFNRWHSLVITLQQSGPTTQRPASQLWVGRVFFDTTLGKPVWLKSVNPDVWVDASGAVV